MFKRTLLLFVCVLFSSMSLLGSTSPQLRIVTEHFPPYQVVKDSEVVSGKAYDIVNAALAEYGAEVKIEVLPWARAYEIALKQPNTIIFSIAKTVERTPLFHWLFELGRLDFNFYSSKKDNTVKINSMNDAKKYILVAVRGSYEADKLMSLGFRLDNNLVLVNNFAHAWRMLDKGRAHAIYASHIPPKILYSSLHGYTQHPTVFEHRFLYVAVSLTTPAHIVSKLEQAFKRITPIKKSQ